MFQHYAMSSYALTCALLKSVTGELARAAAREAGRCSSDGVKSCSDEGPGTGRCRGTAATRSRRWRSPRRPCLL